jgi:hypothetical protein
VQHGKGAIRFVMIGIICTDSSRGVAPRRTYCFSFPQATFRPHLTRLTKPVLRLVWMAKPRFGWSLFFQVGHRQPRFTADRTDSPAAGFVPTFAAPYSSAIAECQHLIDAVEESQDDCAAQRSSVNWCGRHNTLTPASFTDYADRASLANHSSKSSRLDRVVVRCARIIAGRCIFRRR